MIKKVFIVFIVLSNTFFSCKSKAQDSIQVSFKIDDDIQSISDSFNICFIHQNDTSKANVRKETIFVPALTDSLYTIIFSYKNYALEFDSIPKSMIIPANETGWNFGIENRPFSQIRGLLPTEEYTTDTITKQLYYLQFSPAGLDGVQIVKKRY